MTSTLKKLEITAYADETFSRPAPVDKLVVPINPDKYSRSINIDYDDTKGQGAAGGSPVFNRYALETIVFQLMFDATGVLPPPPAGVVSATNGVADQITALRRVTCDYDGKIHSPRFLKLVWGTLLFKCRLKSLDLTYTLFRPDGMPLRATATANFVGFVDESELQRKIKRSSPDLTHLVTVKPGDTLPLLCHRIYGRSEYYPQVADVNGLTGFRALRPGMQLMFPPLVGSA